MPISHEFRDWLEADIGRIAAHFGTPFHILDERGMRETAQRLTKAFSPAPGGFREFFAVKANPNLKILEIMRDCGFGFDCSSPFELGIVRRRLGAEDNDIMFTSNNTSQDEYEKALSEDGCILNLDDASFVPKVPDPFPELVSFRYNPGERRSGNAIIGEPSKAKFGVPHEDLVQSYQMAINRGAKQFGLHTMICSNERDGGNLIETMRMCTEVAASVSNTLGIRFEFINIGGGFGTPYHPDHPTLQLEEVAAGVIAELNRFKDRYGYAPKLLMENGRYLTGPHGVFVARVINRMKKYRQYVGLDAACTSSVMRPAFYGSEGDGYHHLSVVDGDGRPREKASVVGPVCENCDYFAEDRDLPVMHEGDLVYIHNTGAHALAMTSNYNVRGRPQVLLRRVDGSVIRIQREETLEDLLATQQCDPFEMNAR